jgi:hypothetical protein
MARRAFASLAAACVLAATLAPAALAQTPINEPPALPVVIAVLPSSDAIEASGFTEGDLVDVLVIRNGVTVNTTTGLVPEVDPKNPVPFAGILNVNGGAATCWAGTTPDLRAGDIVRFVSHMAGGNIRSIDQVHIMPITISTVTSVGGGMIEVHGMGGDLNGAPIDIVNALQVRLIATGTFAVNGKRTLRAGGGTTDGTISYDLGNNPGGLHWTARFGPMSAADVTNALGAEPRVLWLGSVPANANELTIYQNGTLAVPGPLAGTCATALEPVDVAAPTAPGTLTSTQTAPSDRTLTWRTSTDNVAVLGYDIFRDGVLIGTNGPLDSTYVDAGIPAGSHTYNVKAFDTASPRGAGANTIAQIAAGFGQPWGNLSAASNSITITQADIVPPTAPTTVTAAPGNGKATLTWSGATDNVGVVKYGLFRNNVLIQTLNAPTAAFKDSGLVTGSYTYAVDAIDAAALHSPKSTATPVNVVFIPDTTPPTVPGSAVAVTSPDLHGRDVNLTWGASTDSMGVTGYEVFRNGSKIATLAPTTFNFHDAALATATYTYRVDAFDASANHSALSAPVTAVVANDPPAAAHVLVAHPSRDAITATGYPAAAGPYVFQVFRGAQVFTSSATAADAGGNVAVNTATGGCWTGTTPDLRAGDVVRVTNAAGIAEQTTLADLTTQFAIGVGGSTVVVHGTARDAAGHPLPLAQIEHRLVIGAGLFVKNASSTLRATPAAGGDGTLVYDAPGSTHWTATYSGLSPDDLARATGGVTSTGSTLPAAESRSLWLGRSPAAGTEQSVLETGPVVSGGPAAGACITPADAPAATAALLPGSLSFGGVSAIPPVASSAQTVEVHNNGNAPMTIGAVYIAGQNAGEFAIVTTSNPSVLAPGASFSVDVKFAPTVLGPRHAALCVASDAANAPSVSILIDGTGVTDVTPPTVPQGVASSQSPDVHGKDAAVSWSAATDSVGVTGYTVYRDGVAITTVGPNTLAFHDAALPPGVHAYTIDAFDARNNHSAASAPSSTVIPSEPPAATHVLIAHPDRDAISGLGYPAAQGPYQITLYRGNQVVATGSMTADASGALQLNAPGGGCWNGMTPDLRRGDVIRISNAAGVADQTTVLDLRAGYAIATDSNTIVVHGVARMTGGQPLAIDQVEQQLSMSTGTFDANGTSTLRASTAPGANGTIAFDSPGSANWTATYTGLSAEDMARAAGAMPAESRVAWMGGSEQTLDETGPGVMGGPVAGGCGAAPESSVPAGAFLPARVDFGRQPTGAGASATQQVFFSNSGTAPMSIGDVRIAGLNAGDFSIVSNDAPAVLAPGEYFSVKVAFAPHKMGNAQASLYLSCDAANTTALSVALAGQGWNGHVVGAPGIPARTFALGSTVTPLDGGSPAQGTLPVVVSWTPSANTPSAQYNLQVRTNGGAFEDAPVQPGSDTQVTLPLALSAGGAVSTWQFRVRAVDGGDASGWAVGEPFGLEPVDETRTDRIAFTGAWLPQSIAGAYGGSVRTSWGKLGVELLGKDAFGATGSVALLATKGPYCGKVSIRIDSRDSVVVSLYAPVLQRAAVAFVASNLAQGIKHRLLIRTLAEGDPQGTGAQVDVDGFVVLNNAARAAAPVIAHGPGGALTAGEAPAMPSAFAFSPIYPNPIAGRAVLRFALPHDGTVQLDVLDVQGRRVAQLANGMRAAGEQQLSWDGRNDAGRAVGSGVYFAVLRFGGQTLTHRMIVMP